MALIARGAAFAIAGLTVLAGLIRRDVQALEGGTKSPHGHFIIVGSFAPERSALGSGFSGVHIAPRWVLTAAHAAPARGAIFVDRCGMAGVAEVLTFPSRVPTHSPLAGAPRDDLALVRLAAPIPCPYFPRLADDEALPRQDAFADLAARTDATLVSNHPSITAQRFGFARIRAVYRAPGLEFVVVSGERVALTTGDSGSPLFMGRLTDTDRDSVVLGVASAHYVSHTGVADDVYTLVGPYRALLDAAVEATGENLQWYSAPRGAPLTSKDESR